MEKVNRRQFLKAVGTGIGALTTAKFLAACGNQPQETINPTETENPLPSLTPEPDISLTEANVVIETPTNNIETVTPIATQANPDLVVARGDDPAELVRQAITALGGMDKFVHSGAKVIIKPNICVAYHPYEYAATTNPWVVGALVKLCLEAGAKSVQVMDFPFGGSAQEAYAISGIEEQVKAAGGEMAYMPGFKYLSTDIPMGIDLKKTDIFEDILTADVLINVPIAKHHSLATLTLGMKNLLGVIRNRSAIHQNLGQRVADLASLVKPTLTVMDAVRILMANGPTGGNLTDVQQTNTVIVSQDFVAVDSYSTSLFNLKPDDIAYISAAAAMGLGQKNLENLKLEEIAVGA